MVKASVIPGRVPLGFVCGYPLAGGELYGGSMFARSAAPDTAQGRAIQAVNERWGDHKDELCGNKKQKNGPTQCRRQRKGRETIGIPVCKKKYKPFHFEVVTEADGRLRVAVERMYGCRCHHPQRKRVIERHGVRNGWQPFGVWSRAKARAQARRETARLNHEQQAEAAASSSIMDEETSSSSSDEEDDNNNNTNNTNVKVTAATLTASKRKPCRTMCLNGNCTWKVRSAYDNIYKEIHGESEDDG